MATKKKAVRKVVAKKRRSSKVPDMKDVLGQHAKVEKARKLMEVCKAQAAARKKEYEGAVADLSSLLEDARKGQGRLY